MHTTRFQVGLTTALSLCLGATLAVTLSSQVASGYPSSAISRGTNPVMAAGGSTSMPTSGTATATLVTAPTDQDIIVTDLAISGTSDWSSCSERWPVSLSTSEGTNVGEYTAGIGSTNDYSFPKELELHLVAGIRVPAGESLQLSTYRDEWGGSCSWSRTATIRWAISGYHAQP